MVDSGILFQTVEHLFQYKKASYFNDAHTAKLILNAKTPRIAKALGKKVKDFDEQLWTQVAVQHMHKACTLKFEQNRELAAKLRDIRGTIIEANPGDSFFSCGLSINDPNLTDQAKWKGQNHLGTILSNLRDSL